MWPGPPILLITILLKLSITLIADLNTGRFLSLCRMATETDNSILEVQVGMVCKILRLTQLNTNSETMLKNKKDRAGTHEDRYEGLRCTSGTCNFISRLETQSTFTYPFSTAMALQPSKNSSASRILSGVSAVMPSRFPRPILASPSVQMITWNSCGCGHTGEENNKK